METVVPQATDDTLQTRTRTNARTKLHVNHRSSVPDAHHHQLAYAMVVDRSDLWWLFDRSLFRCVIDRSCTSYLTDVRVSAQCLAVAMKINAVCVQQQTLPEIFSMHAGPP